MKATIPKGIVGGFKFTVLQRNPKEWHERPWILCLRVLKESHKDRFDSYSVRNSELIVSHITFRNCRVHNFSDNLRRNSCISVFRVVVVPTTRNTKYNWKIAITSPKWPEKETDSKRYNKQVSQNLRRAFYLFQYIL